MNRIMNILKNIFTVAVAAGMGLASVSCSDYLDTQKYFKDEQSLEKIFNDDWMRANGFADVVERTTKPSLAEQYL